MHWLCLVIAFAIATPSSMASEKQDDKNWIAFTKSATTHCAKEINALRSPSRSTIFVTHYQRLLDYITPDFIHILHHGQIIQSDGKELALELEQKGYGWIQS